MTQEPVEDRALPQPWFARRRPGWGIGMPIAWQGWLLLASYLALLAGIKALDHSGWAAGKPIAFALFLPLTAIFLVVAGKRTPRRTDRIETDIKEAVAMSTQDTLFVCHRRGWRFYCQPRGKAGWLALLAWTLPLLPFSLVFAWLLLRLPESIVVIAVAFTLMMLLWTAAMTFWIASRSEMVDLRAGSKPESSSRKPRS